MSKSVIVQRGNSPVTNGNVYAAPNILKGVTSTTVMVNSGTALTLTVSLYDTAGELVKRPVTGAAGSNQVNLDASGLASGLYLVMVDLTDGNGHFGPKAGHQDRHPKVTRPAKYLWPVKSFRILYSEPRSI